MRAKAATLRQPGRRRRGAMLVLVLWLIIVLSVMAYSLTWEMRMGLKMTSQGRKRVQALGLARAGLAHAVMDLRNDQVVKVAQGVYSNDHLAEFWALTEDKTEVELGEGVYTVRVVDEQGKIDLNLLGPQSLEALVYLLHEVCREGETEARMMAEALVDYIDWDNRPLTGDEGSEEEYYTEESWKHFSDRLPEAWTYRPKNDFLLNIDELLEVPGFTRELLYGVPGEMPVDPLARLELEDASTALVDYVTVGHGSPVNINTAPKEVYGALLAAGSPGEDVRRAAEDIDKLRWTLLDQETDAGRGFVSPAQLAEAGIDIDLLARLAVIPLGVSTRHFTIISRGTVDGVSQTIEARVTLSLQSYNMDRRRPPEQQYIHDLKAMAFLKDRREQIIDPTVRVIQYKSY